MIQLLILYALLVCMIRFCVPTTWKEAVLCVLAMFIACVTAVFAGMLSLIVAGVLILFFTMSWVSEGSRAASFVFVITLLIGTAVIWMSR